MTLKASRQPFRMKEEHEAPVVKNLLHAAIEELEGNITLRDYFKKRAGRQNQREGQNMAKVNINKMKGDFRTGDTFE